MAASLSLEDRAGRPAPGCQPGHAVNGAFVDRRGGHIACRRSRDGAERDSRCRMAHDILIVDDEPDIRLLIDGILRDEGYETREAGDSDGAMAAFRARRPSLVILDVWLQGSRLDGLGMLEIVPERRAASAGGDDLRPWHDRDGGRARSSTAPMISSRSRSSPIACCCRCGARWRRRRWRARTPSCGCASGPRTA